MKQRDKLKNDGEIKTNKEEEGEEEKEEEKEDKNNHEDDYNAGLDRKYVEMFVLKFQPP